MDDPIDIEVVRTEALRKLGRNIVNLSKIEGVLKYLLSLSQIKGLSTSPPNPLLSKQTLGQLVQELHKTVIVDDSQPKPQLDSSGLGIP